MPPPRPSYRLFRAGWIMARAFTPHPVFAVLTVPWAVLSILPGTLRGGLYLDPSRTGMVMLYRSRLALDVLILIPPMAAWMITSFLAIGAAAFLLPGDGTLALLFLAWLVLCVLGAVFLLPERGGASFPAGPETPPGERWEIAGLAQLPGTRLTAIQLALRVVDQVPPAGAVIIAVAQREDLLRSYERLGFTAGPKRRVHKVVDG